MVKLDLLALVDKLTPVLVVIIPSYFSFKSTKTTKEADKRIEGLSNKIDTLEKSVSSVEEIGKDNQRNLTIIGKGLQRLQRFRLQENLKKIIQHIGQTEYLYTVEDNVICKLINQTLMLNDRWEDTEKKPEIAFLKA